MSTEKDIARKLQQETGARYTTCLGRVRACKQEAEEQHASGGRFAETWLAVARRYVKKAPRPDMATGF